MCEYIIDKKCFFCEKYHNDRRCIEERCGIWFCSSDYCNTVPFTKKCYSFGQQYDNASDEKECPICFNYKNIIKLPTCTHEMCIDCCKTNYFGTNSNTAVMSGDEYMMRYGIAVPDTIDEEQYDYYEEFRTENEYGNFGIEPSIEERKIIRDGLKNDRPGWMNTESFIDFENKEIEFSVNMGIAEDRYNQYKKNMIISNNKCCPMCRAKPDWSDDELCEYIQQN